MKTLLILIIALMPVTVTLAQDPGPKKPAEELLDLMKFKETMTGVSTATFQPFLNQMRQKGLPEAGVNEVSKAADIYFNKVASDPGLMKELIALYEKEFTEAEIKELIAFYNTPIGKKSLEKLPILTQAGGKLGEKYAIKHQADFQAKMTRIMQEYPAAP